MLISHYQVTDVDDDSSVNLKHFLDAQLKTVLFDFQDRT